jgi:hypothetical protein
MVREYDDLEQGAYVEGYHSTDSRRVDDVDPLLTIQVPVPNNDPSLSSSSTTSHSWKRFGSRLLPKKNPFGRRSSNKKRRSKNNHHNQKEHTPLLHLTSLMKRGKGRRSGTPSKLPNNNAPSSLTENGNGSDQSRRPMPQQHNKERATKHWNAVRQHLKNGDFILQGVACKAPESSENDDDNHPHDHPHDVIVQQAIEDIRKGMEFHLDHCVIAIVVYLAISILCYNFFLQPEWTIVDSCYFSVTTFTTVGYGDEIPTTPASMIFTCIYAMVGVTCLGIALGIIGSNLMDAQDRIKKKADTLMQTKALSFFGEQEQDDDDDTLEEEEDAQREASRCGCCFTVFGQLPLLALLLVLAFFIGYESGWNSLKTIYYLIITGKEETTFGNTPCCGDNTTQHNTRWSSSCSCCSCSLTFILLLLLYDVHSLYHRLRRFDSDHRKGQVGGHFLYPLGRRIYGRVVRKHCQLDHGSSIESISSPTEITRFDATGFGHYG